MNAYEPSVNKQSLIITGAHPLLQRVRGQQAGRRHAGQPRPHPGLPRALSGRRRRLHRAARWRQRTSASGREGREGRGEAGGGGGGSRAERQLHTTLIAVSCVHVLCTLPSVAKDSGKFFWRDFNIAGHYRSVQCLVSLNVVLTRLSSVHVSSLWTPTVVLTTTGQCSVSSL